MKNLLLITGAGASHDVVDFNAVDVDLICRPPLTRHLFRPPFEYVIKDGETAVVQSKYIDTCLERHPIAQAVGIGLTTNIHRDDSQDAGMEKILLNIKNHPKKLTRRKFWTVPIYLYDLFTYLSKNYIRCITRAPVATNYTWLIDAINNSEYEQLIWLNLNYDLFADFAIKSAANTNLDNFEKYMRLQTPDGLKIKYTKPHGSIDWYKTINVNGLGVNSLSQDALSTNESMIPDDLEKRLSTQTLTHQEVVNNKLNSNLCYPAITAPLGQYNYVIKDHITQIIKDLKTTTDILCVGFSALDEDILDLMKEHIPSVDKLLLVNNDVSSGELAYERIKKHVKTFKAVKSMSLFNGGFSGFVKNGLKQWLKNEYEG